MRRKPIVLLALGTRPEAIKLAPVARALKARGVAFQIVSTGQHRSMLQQTLRALGLRVSWELGLMRPDQAQGELAKRAFPRLLALVARARPALVVVQGDTTTALCAALAAFHEGIPVAHVEAGLRSGDLSDPFPEEANRVLIDDLSALLFAPTRDAARRLRGAPGKVFVTGNTAVDALRAELGRRLVGRDDDLILVTMHRRESFDGGLAAACAALREVLDRCPRARLVFPVHLNPNVQRVVRRELRHPRARLLPPLDYGDFVALLRRCRFVMTDSGGLQEEAACLGKPTLVLRRVTDRPEAVRAGVAAVVGFVRRKIVSKALALLEDERAYRRMARRTAIFGDGRAGERIARAIEAFSERAWSDARRRKKPNG